MREERVKAGAGDRRRGEGVKEREGHAVAGEAKVRYDEKGSPRR